MKQMMALAAAGFILLLAVAAWGHGDEHQAEAMSMQQHMKQMYQLKQQIPAEYQVMNRTPVRPDEQSLALGSRLYEQHCAACHGATGAGDGPAAAALATPPANFHDRQHSTIYGPGEKYWIIGQGSGQTGMPGFEKALSPRDRWDLVNHIYWLQQGDH